MAQEKSNELNNNQLKKGNPFRQLLMTFHQTYTNLPEDDPLKSPAKKVYDQLLKKLALYKDDRKLKHKEEWMMQINSILSSDEATQLTTHPDGKFKTLFDGIRWILNKMGCSYGSELYRNKIKIHDDVTSLKTKLKKELILLPEEEVIKQRIPLITKYVSEERTELQQLRKEIFEMIDKEYTTLDKTKFFSKIEYTVKTTGFVRDPRETEEKFAERIAPVKEGIAPSLYLERAFPEQKTGDESNRYIGYDSSGEALKNYCKKNKKDESNEKLHNLFETSRLLTPINQYLSHLNRIEKDIHDKDYEHLVITLPESTRWIKRLDNAYQKLVATETESNTFLSELKRLIKPITAFSFPAYKAAHQEIITQQDDSPNNDSTPTTTPPTSQPGGSTH